LSILQDLRFAARLLWKTPGFMAVAVLTLALGIGANTAVFSVLDPLLLRKLPVRNPDELVWVHYGGTLGTSESSEMKDFQLYRSHNAVFSGVCGFSSIEPYDIDHDGRIAAARRMVVSGDYFTVLGVRALRGRLLVRDDETSGSGIPVVLNFDYWKREFGADPRIVGKTLQLGKVVYTIAGVTPPEFLGTVVGDAPDIYLPPWDITRNPAHDTSQIASRGIPGWNGMLKVLGRLKPGVTIDQAHASLEPLFQEMVRQSGLVPEEQRQAMAWLLVTPAGRGLSELRERFSLPARILMAVVGVVLLIACSNVANLLLSRGFARAREITVRMALGAGRQRLVRQFLTESALLAAMGAAAGLLVGAWTSRILVSSLATDRLPIVLESGVNIRVALFTALVLTACVFLCGLAPALSATRGDLAGRLKIQRAGLGRSFSRSRLGKTLVAIQVALSVTLLIGGGLLLHSLAKLSGVDTGFNRDQVLAVTFIGQEPSYIDPQVASFHRRLLDRAEHLPGVRSAVLSLTAPFSGRHLGINVTSDDFTVPPGDEPRVFLDEVTPGYFALMGIPLLAGRDFTAHDDANSPRVAVINQTMARHYFGGSSPLGKRFRFVEGKFPPMEIVGVVADFKYDDLRKRADDSVYTSWQQMRATSRRIAGTLNIRFDGKMKQPLTASLRSLIPELDSTVAAASIKTLGESIDESLQQDRLISSLCGAFAILALALTCVGLYGTLSASVAQRTNEIGVRMALGARAADVVAMILREGMALVLAGGAIGVAGALVLTRAVSALLYGITATDPATFAGVVLLLTATALATCYAPARRASRMDPMAALRDE